MARMSKPQHSYHRVRIRTDRNDGEVLIVRGGKNGIRAYLWAGRDTDGVCVTVSGRATLRRLAYEILAEVGK